MIILLSTTASLVLSGCGNGFFPEMDDKELPHYKLAATEQAWVTPYQVGTEWRFRNAAGYVRRYQVKGFSDRVLPGIPTNSFSVQYYQQEAGARLERVDSAFYQRPDGYKHAATFTISAAADFQNQPLPLTARLEWGLAKLPLPIAEVNSRQTLPTGVLLLPEAVFAGRTHQNVLVYPNLQAQPGEKLEAWMVTSIYYTKELGVVRFVEANGTVWDRE
ncbi:hypothetical protein GCM10023186_06250 [Hymenobacter koreensis]|uniref:Uncharacterized protein n=1 Tax=Hymenobacter koreensis TaxID=1084523 RepID=A0ABP8IUU2_9BACT